MVVKERKSGISLISLIITIIVIIILSAIVIFSGMDTPEKAQLSKVISDIDNVQTAVDQAYYGLYTEKAVAGEVWTQSQFYEAVAIGETDRNKLSGDGLIEIGENSLVDINLPVYEGRKWYVAVSDMSDTIKIGSAVLFPGFESQGKTYATLLDVQTGGGYAIVEPKNVDDWEWTTLEDDTLQITKYNGSDTSVVVPNYINGKKVVSIAGVRRGNLPFGAFSSEITDIIISNGIEELSDAVFARCVNLRNVTIPNSVTTIGIFTFVNCTSLPSITIPNSVISIGSNAFYGCSNLASVIIPSSVTTIESRAFADISDSAQIKCEISEKPDGWDSSWTNCSNVKWKVE